MLCWFLLYNSSNQPQAYKYPVPLGPPSHAALHPIPLGHHRAELSSLCCAAASCQLSILHMVMYMCGASFSLNSSHPLLPLLCQQVCSQCLCLYACPTDRFIGTIFLDSIYVH